jgi:hypothetical protein
MELSNEAMARLQALYARSKSLEQQIMQARDGDHLAMYETANSLYEGCNASMLTWLAEHHDALQAWWARQSEGEVE